MLPATRHPSLAPTLTLCALMLLGFGAQVWRVSSGLELWTFEDLRRQSAAAGRLRWPASVLQDASGRTAPWFQPGTGAEELWLVDFFYTRCPSICQALGSELFQAQEQLKARPVSGLRLLSVSIDPEHDSPAELDAYGRLHKADAAIWHLARLNSVVATRAALDAIGVIAVPDGLGGYAHNGSLHLMDGQGRVLRIFENAQWQEALATAQSLASQRAQP